MLSDFIINSIDSFNIIYLWVILTKKNNNIFKLLSSVLIFSVLVTAIEQLGLNFIITYIAGIMTIKIIYKGYLKEVISGYILVLLIEISLGLIFSLFINKLIYDDTYIAIITELIILVITIISSKTKLFKKNIIFELIDNNALIYFIVVCFSYASVFKIIWNYDDTIILNNLFSISLIFCTLVISQFLTYLYLLKVIKERETLNKDNMIL